MSKNHEKYSDFGIFLTSPVLELDNFNNIINDDPISKPLAGKRKQNNNTLVQIGSFHRSLVKNCLKTVSCTIFLKVIHAGQEKAPDIRSDTQQQGSQRGAQQAETPYH